jgi:hypothetical protein
VPSNAIAATRSAIEREREALEFDLGPFTLEDDEAHDEVILVQTDDLQQRFRCYLVDDRLFYDDYFPTEAEREG